MSAAGGEKRQREQDDTRLTKLFVGGLAWETTKEGVRGYFQQFGEIAEAAVIADRSTGRSKGYGFVTFREAEAATRACLDPYPVIDGRRANCNLAYLGLHKPKQSLQVPYAAVTHVHGGGNSNTRAMKVAIAAAGGTSFFPDHGIQQGIPAAAYNVYGYSPYFSDYSYQPLTYYQAYGAGLAGGAPPSYQVFNGGAGAATAMAAADPTGLVYPCFQQYGPAMPMQYPPQFTTTTMVYQPQYAAAGGDDLQQYGGAVVPNMHPAGQAAALPSLLPAQSFVSMAPVAAPAEQKKKPLSSA